MRKGFLYTLLILALFLANLLLYERFSLLRERLNRTYKRFKEVEFMLKNVKGKGKLNEESLRKVLNSLSLFPEKIIRGEEGIEIYFGSIESRRLFLLINELERRGWEIKLLRAKDNTGKGKFNARLVLSLKR